MLRRTLSLLRTGHIVLDIIVQGLPLVHSDQPLRIIKCEPGFGSTENLCGTVSVPEIMCESSRKLYLLHRGLDMEPLRQSILKSTWLELNRRMDMEGQGADWR